MSSRPELKIAFCSHEAAKYAVEKWHYSRTMPKSKLVKFGVWESEKFIGSVIYGVGATSDLVKRYGLTMTQGCELVRVALTDHRTEVSRIIAITLKILKKHQPELALVVSFADPNQGHVGGIYKAGGWKYLGRSVSSDEYLFLGRRWQGRSFRHRFKGMENDPRVLKVPGSQKYRYAYPLTEDAAKKVEPFELPYPAREA